MKTGTYEMDGFVFSDPSSPYILLEGGDTTSPISIRTQDADSPRSDMKWFGRDYFSAPERTFIIGVDTTDPLALPRLRSAWRGDSVRTTPGRVSTLRWNLNGTTYRAEGRPREFEVLGQDRHDPEWAVVQATFQYRDTYVLEDEEQRVSLTVHAPITGAGIVLPQTLPFSLSPSSPERVGVINLEATAPAPFKVTIDGPTVGSATNIRVWGGNWGMQFGSLVLMPYQSITVDTLHGTAMIGNRNVAGSMTLMSNLQARLSPGTQEFRFACNDLSGSTRTTISWRNSVPLI